MSVKHVLNYYNKVCRDYWQMMDLVHVLEKEVETKMTDEEILNRTMEPTKVQKHHYDDWSYFLYLLNMPNKPEKQKKYIKQNKKKLDSIPRECTIEGTLEENAEALKQFKNNIYSLE